MSADTQPRPATASTVVVLPVAVTDKSIIESVTGFISDVVPQVTAGGHGGDSRDLISWARFEQAENGEGLLLVLGYGSGVQVWSVNSSGEAHEALSWRRGVVRTMRVLLSPDVELRDAFAHKRPIVALCDSAGPGQQFCSLSFVSLRTGDQVKIIKYKNPVNDVLCSRRVVVVSFQQKLAILDAGTLEEKKAIVTCYPVTGPNPNPIALGSCWLAYAEKRVSTSLLSNGGAEEISGPSVTATVLHAAKSLGKVVANSLTGQRPPIATSDGQSGAVTILDVNKVRCADEPIDEVVAHFVAHPEPIVAISFDPSGMLLFTADKSGHDFHVFRIHPHACGSSGAAIHHLYVLHRGDTTAKVQDVAWTTDSRWIAVSTLRGTTHLFAMTGYGGAVSVRTHLSPRVVNRLSRYQRSAGLSADGRNSPETVVLTSHSCSPNPRLPPFPHPTTLHALAHIRQSQQPVHDVPRTATRQSSTEDPSLVPVRLSACFASPRGWVTTAKPSQKTEKRLVDSLFLMSCSGNLIEYQLKPRPASGVPREKVCEATTLELDVEAKAQWRLLRTLHTSELQLPLSPSNPLMLPQSPPELPLLEDDEHWLSQVEIVTHAGPHRRLWMGPQFSFKTFSKDSEPVDVGIGPRSNPVNIPLGSSSQPVVPVLIESASSTSLEQSPRFHPGSEDSDSSVGPGESQLAESLADAMMENSTAPTQSVESPDFISL